MTLIAKINYDFFSVNHNNLCHQRSILYHIPKRLSNFNLQVMKYNRMPIEVESPEMMGYENVKYNLAESSVSDVLLSELNLQLNELLLCYGHHIGKPQLRTLIANLYSKDLSIDNILITPSAATALFIAHTTLLEKEDTLLVMRPNYATNIETPRAIGCRIEFIDLLFENNFQPDIESVREQIDANTKLISITTPHNPTGVSFSEEIIDQLITIAEERNIFLLIDETYKDLQFTKTQQPYYANKSDRVISVSSVSKAYGIPGVRIGWLACKNKQLMQSFLAAKEQILICNSVVDEEIAYQFLLKRKDYLPAIQERIQQNFSYLENYLQDHSILEWVKPTGGVISFPRIKESINIDIEKFYKTLNNKYQTFVGAGHWFEQSKRYFRLGFGYSEHENFKQALSNIDKALKESRV